MPNQLRYTLQIDSYMYILILAIYNFNYFILHFTGFILNKITCQDISRIRPKLVCDFRSLQQIYCHAVTLQYKIPFEGTISTIIFQYHVIDQVFLGVICCTVKSYSQSPVVSLYCLRDFFLKLNYPLILSCYSEISYVEGVTNFVIVYGPSYGLTNFEVFQNTASKIG